MVTIFMVGISSFFLGFVCSSILSSNTITELRDELEQRDLDNDEIHTCLNKTFDRLGG